MVWPEGIIVDSLNEPTGSRSYPDPNPDRREVAAYPACADEWINGDMAVAWPSSSIGEGLLLFSRPRCFRLRQNRRRKTMITAKTATPATAPPAAAAVETWDFVFEAGFVVVAAPALSVVPPVGVVEVVPEVVVVDDGEALPVVIAFPVPVEDVVDVFEVEEVLVALVVVLDDVDNVVPLLFGGAGALTTSTCLYQR